jgi:hypothetical protein
VVVQGPQGCYNVYFKVVMKDLYSTPESRLDTILGDSTFWSRMQRCRATEGNEHCKTEADTIVWFRETYGIQLLPSDTHVPGYSQDVNIVDEQKYMIFLLKWS